MTTATDDTIRASEEAENPLFYLVSSYGRPYWSYFGTGLAAQTLSQIPSRIPGLIVGIAFDAVFLETTAYRLPLVPDAWIPDGQMALFWFTAALLVGAYLLSDAFSVVSSLAYSWFNLNLLHDVRTDSYEAMQRLSLSYFEGEQTGEILSVLHNDVDNLQSFTRGTLSSIISMPLSVGVAFAFMAWLNWQLAVVLLFVPLVIPVISYWYSNTIRPVHREARARIGSLNSRFQNNVSGIGTIKANTAEEREISRVETAASERRDTHVEQAKYQSAIRPVGLLVQNAGIITVVALGGYWILRGAPAFLSGSFSAGALVTFVMYARSFFQPMRQLPGIVDNYENAQASAERIVGLLADPDVLPEVDGAAEPEIAEGRVEYENVSFAYDGGEEPTLCDVSLEAGSGETVGIVGPTGAGKSTLAKLLFRFYDVDDGAVRVDGHDVRDVSIRSLRGHLGYVGQEPFLFNGTVAENVAYGAGETNHEAIVKATRQSGAREFVTDLEDGYDTAVGERGVKLSGGQRQRLAIARAILQDPAILVLDEATSHVDNETEALIQRNLDTLIAERTTLVIAHRLSTIRDSDQILVLEDGGIVERGTHEELIDEDGLYANLWRVQIGEVEALPESFVERTRQLEATE